jgi:hypothetical protein
MLEQTLGSVTDVARYLYHSNVPNQDGLLLALAIRADLSLPYLLMGNTSKAPQDTRLYVLGLLEIAAELEDADQAMHLVLSCSLSPSQLRSELMMIENSNEPMSDMAARVRNEILYTTTDVCGDTTPMNVSQTVQQAVKIHFNGLREGACQFVGKGSVLFAQNVLNASVSAPYSMGFMALAGIGIPHVMALTRVSGLESEEYQEQPSQIWNFATVFSVTVPIMFPQVALLATVAGGLVMVFQGAAAVPLYNGATALASAATAASNVISSNTLSRVLRQGLMDLSSNPACAGFKLVHKDGTGLTAQEQKELNILRDALYVLACVVVIGVGGAFAQNYLRALFAMNGLIAQHLGKAMADALLGSIVEYLDGMFPDIAKAVVAACNSELVLQPGEQKFVNKQSFESFKTQTAGRVVTGSVPDLFSAMATVADSCEAPSAVSATLRGLGALMTGLFMGPRGRTLNALATDKPIFQDGTKNPAGLLSVLASGTRDAMVGLADLVLGGAEDEQAEDGFVAEQKPRNDGPMDGRDPGDDDDNVSQKT